MTLHLCQVTGTLVAPNGSLLPEVQVQFLPAPVTVRGSQGGTLAPQPVSLTTGADATLDVALAPGVYTVRARSAEGRDYPPFLVDVPGTPAAALGEILMPLPAPQSVYDAVASARTAGKAAGEVAAHARAILAADTAAADSAGTAAAAAATAQAEAAGAATAAQTATGQAGAAQTAATAAQSSATSAQTSAATAGSAALSATAAAAAADTSAAMAEASQRTFASRAAFEAAALPADLGSWSVLHAGQRLDYRQDPDGTAIAGANGLRGSPATDPTPLHWGAAPEAAPAVNTAAFNACAAWAHRMRIPAGRYRIDGPIVFAPTAGDRVPCVVEGAGASATVIEQTAPEHDVFVFAHADPAQDLGVRPVVRDLAIEAPGATAAHRGAAIRHHASLTAAFQNLILDGPTFGIVAERGVQSYHAKIFWTTRTRATGEMAEAAFVFDTDTRPGGVKLRSFGSYISDCEFQAGRGTRTNLVIRSLDGLYVNNCHFGFAERHVLIDPDGTEGRETVLDLRVVNCYFDLGGQNGNILQNSVQVRAAGVADSVSIRGLHFTGCLFRGANGARALSFDTAPGALGAISWLQSITFTGCEFRLFTQPAIDLRGPAGFDARTRLRGVTVTGCMHAIGTGPRSRAVVLAGGAISLSGNVYRGGWSAGDARPILVGGDCERVSISGEVFDAEVEGLDAVEVAPGAMSVGLHGMVGNASATGRSIVDEGRDADGWWVRYADGWQVCGRSFTVPGAAINTPYGGLFRSGDLVTATQRGFPRPFLTGAEPTVTMQARVTNYPSMEIKSGTASHFQWPVALRVVTDIALGARDVQVNLRAEGPWK